MEVVQFYVDHSSIIITDSLLTTWFQPKLTIYWCHTQIYSIFLFLFLPFIQVFDRERLNGHYGTCAFIISNSFSAIPYLLLISLIPGAIAYYPSGLQRGAEHFLFFASILFPPGSIIFKRALPSKTLLTSIT